MIAINKFPFNERFRLATDRNFMLTMPLGFALTLAYLIFSWRWTLALSIVLLQGTIGTPESISRHPRFSMILSSASAIAEPPYNTSHRQPAEAFWGWSGKSIKTRPMGALIRAVVVSAGCWALPSVRLSLSSSPPSNRVSRIVVNRVTGQVHLNSVTVRVPGTAIMRDRGAAGLVW